MINASFCAIAPSRQHYSAKTSALAQNHRYEWHLTKFGSSVAPVVTLIHGRFDYLVLSASCLVLGVINWSSNRNFGGIRWLQNNEDELESNLTRIAL